MNKAFTYSFSIDQQNRRVLIGPSAKKVGLSYSPLVNKVVKILKFLLNLKKINTQIIGISKEKIKEM